MDTSELTRLIEAAGLSSALATPPQARVDAILRDAAAALGVNAATHWWWAHKDVALTPASDGIAPVSWFALTSNWRSAGTLTNAGIDPESWLP